MTPKPPPPKPPVPSAKAGMDRNALRALYGAPNRKAVLRRIEGLPEQYRCFVRHSPFVVLATNGPDGIAMSMRGGVPGFVSVDGDGRLTLPDNPGNNRLESLSNLIDDPRIGLLFLVPGEDEALRVSGTATVVRAGNKAALSIEPQVSFLHCAAAVARSRLWRGL